MSNKDNLEKFVLYKAVISHDFAETTCFLCGAKIVESNETKEHVFPKWLLNHFGLWDKRITLINGTKIPYRSLVIPCCRKCNNEHLSAIEDEVRDSFMAGPEAVQNMDRETLMLWVIKIFYGLVYREIFLPLERRDPKGGNIVTPKDMEQYQLLHYLLQASRFPITFSQMDSDIPASIYVFQLQEPSNPAMRFDYRDSILYRTLYLRMGKVGILASFDMGAQTIEGQNYFPRYQTHQLHPVQFQELGANLFLKASKFNRVPKVFFSESPNGIKFNVLPIAGLSMNPVFESSTPEELVELLMSFHGYPKEAITSEEGRVGTWLRNQDGSFWHMDINKPPWSI